MEYLVTMTTHAPDGTSKAILILGDGRIREKIRGPACTAVAGWVCPGWGAVPAAPCGLRDDGAGCP